MQGALLLSYLEVIDATYTWRGVAEPDLRGLTGTIIAKVVRSLPQQTK